MKDNRWLHRKFTRMVFKDQTVQLTSSVRINPERFEGYRCYWLINDVMTNAWWILLILQQFFHANGTRNRWVVTWDVPLERVEFKPRSEHIINPLFSNITMQILRSHCHTLPIADAGEFLNLPTEFMLSDHILYSHDFTDWEGADFTKRNLTLITIDA